MFNSKFKNGAYTINLDECKSIGTHWIALHVNGDNITYFDNFGVEYILEKNKKLANNKNIITNLYRMQSLLFINVWIFLYLIY